MLAAGTPPACDALLAGSLVMACVGLLPLLEVAQATAPLSSAAERLPQTLAALAPADRSALVVCGVLSALGAALVVLQLAPPLLAASALRVLRVAAVGVAAGVVLAAAALALALTAESPAAPASLWHAEQLAASERAFEQQVNDVYCHAKGQHVCASGSIADARQVFPLRQWPVGSDSQPGKRVAASCDGFARAVRLWGYPAKMELCRVCADVSAHREQAAASARRRFPHGLADPSAELLRVVPRLSVGELMWCGEYLVQLSSADKPAPAPKTVGDSPYRSHREAFRELLVFRPPPTGWSLRSAVRALQVLLVAAAVSALGLGRWMAQLARLEKLAPPAAKY